MILGAVDGLVEINASQFYFVLVAVQVLSSLKTLAFGQHAGRAID
jgi:hypothetical protein